jgi:hypothetical protein
MIIVRFGIGKRLVYIMKGGVFDDGFYVEGIPTDR